MKETSLLQVKDLKKWFPQRSGLIAKLLGRSKTYVRAVDGVTFSIPKGKIFALAGESGSGKTTLARLMVGLEKATDGSIIFDGYTISPEEVRRHRLYQRMQIVFQDPYGSLNPRMTISDLVSEPLNLNKVCSDEVEKKERVVKTLEEVQLTPAIEFLDRFPHELSGGQRQRVLISRAHILQPTFLILDEPISMVDASTRSGILNMLLDVQKKRSITMCYITHDLAIASYISDFIAVMYSGKIVELGKKVDLIRKPLHPYSQALISVVPTPDPTDIHKKIILKGEVPDLVNFPSGCRFHPRCPYATNKCSQEEPDLIEVDHSHYVACHLTQT